MKKDRNATTAARRRGKYPHGSAERGLDRGDARFNIGFRDTRDIYLMSYIFHGTAHSNFHSCLLYERSPFPWIVPFVDDVASRSASKLVEIPASRQFSRAAYR